MADPHHVEALDGFDRMTVRAYRAGLVGASASLFALVGLHGAAAGGSSVDASWAWWALAAATGLAVQNLHLYAKLIRWVIGAASVTGLVVLSGAENPTLRLAGVGFLFVALSAIALKEQFCFRLPGLRLVPAFLATSLVPLVAGWPGPAAALLLLGALPFAAMTVSKLRMPLTHDIGDRSRYQV